MLLIDHTIPTTMPAPALWALLCESFEDSDARALWPHALESLRCDRLMRDAVVRATYSFGPIKLLQRYDIVVFLAQSRALEYRTRKEHPLAGGGRVEVQAREHGSVLRWRAEYALRPRPDALLAALYTKLYFEPRFFAGLTANLRALEPTSAPDAP